jgi:hypothetical protein
LSPTSGTKDFIYARRDPRWMNEDERNMMKIEMEMKMKMMNFR